MMLPEWYFGSMADWRETRDGTYDFIPSLAWQVMEERDARERRDEWKRRDELERRDEWERRDGWEIRIGPATRNEVEIIVGVLNGLTPNGPRVELTDTTTWYDRWFDGYTVVHLVEALKDTSLGEKVWHYLRGMIYDGVVGEMVDWIDGVYDAVLDLRVHSNYKAIDAGQMESRFRLPLNFWTASLEPIERGSVLGWVDGANRKLQEGVSVELADERLVYAFATNLVFVSDLICVLTRKTVDPNLSRETRVVARELLDDMWTWAVNECDPDFWTLSSGWAEC